MQFSELKSVFSELVDCDVTSIERLEGGRNSQVYCLTCEDSARYTAKFYLRRGLDSRDRSGVEFASLQFLWDNGLRCIPRPIVAPREQGCAIYEYLDGRHIPSEEVTTGDIDEAVAFLVRLKELKSAKGSDQIAPASEACFSGQAIVDNIEQRLSRLSAIQGDEEQLIALHRFLTEDFIPALDEVVRWCRACFDQSQMSFVSELPAEERTLSPSDFGFHNALRLGAGRIVFLDFEHFGWDDPAKMVSDFLLHPAMLLCETLKQRFVAKILSSFEDCAQLEQRIQAVYPLFGLKWCLILLNEFLPEHMLRRRFAGTSDFDRATLCSEQLTKATQLLQRIKREHGHFSYYG